MDSLAQWSQAWKLRLNPTKCHMISFTLRVLPILATSAIDDVTLERRTQLRDLGVILGSKLNFACHVHRYYSSTGVGTSQSGAAR